MGLIDDLQYTQDNLNIIRTKTTLVNNEDLERVAKAVNNMSSNPYLQIKNVTPGTENQVILPDDVYLALSRVNVDGDSNLIPGNIKDGVSIFGVEGTLKDEPSLQIKEVIPSTTEALVVEPDENYYGLSKVTVSRVYLENKNVEPQDTDITVTPTYGFTGLSSVVVKKIKSSSLEVEPDFSSGDVVIIPQAGNYYNEVTVKKDTNLVPENIKEGVVINGITGTYRGQWYTDVVDGTLEIHGDAEVEGGTLDI